jgi:heat shock protein HslJ
MTDRFDDAKRALEGVPANDVWAEAERRAADGTVVPLAAPSAGGGRHRSLWLAGAAAVAALAVGTVAVFASDDDSGVDAGPGSEHPDGESVQVYGDELIPGCVFGMRGEPVLEPHSLRGVESPTGDPEFRGTLAEGALNDQQSYSIQSPGQVVIDLVGERVEDVELQRGTAQIWFQSDAAVQVRWFTGGQDACESFTVTVSGGTEDEKRHAAVELAERVVLESELSADNPVHPTPGGNPLANTEWQLESSTIDGEPTEGDGSLFSFTAGEVTWSDGCNGKGATYTYAAGVLTLSDLGTTDVYCEPNPTSDAINEVMTSGPVSVTFDGSLAILTDGVFELVLRPREARARPAVDTSSLIGTTWTGATR